MAQLTSVPRISLIVVCALTLLLLMPGMPKWPIGILILFSASVWFAGRRRRAESLVGAVLEPGQDAMASDAISAAPIEVMLGRDLSQAWQALRPVLTERISGLRAQREQTTGFTFPSVSFQEGGGLDPLDYEVLIFGVRHGRGALRPDKTLAIRSVAVTRDLPGEAATDPAFGLPAVWIDNDQRDRAQDDGYTLVDPVTVLMTHLAETLKMETPRLLSRHDLVAMLEGVRSRQPGLIEELIPAVMTVSDVQRVLQGLLAEEVSIRSLDQIMEVLVDVGRHTKDHSDLVEKVRERLGYGIFSSLRGEREQLAVMSLSPRVEAQISEAVRRNDGSQALVLEPRLAEQLLRKLAGMSETMIRDGLAPVLLCGPEVRRHLKAFTRRAIPRLAIVAVNEAPPMVDLKSFGVVSVDPA